MAIDLARITKGRLKVPKKAVMHSSEGVGKTSFAIGAPNVFMIDADRGSHLYDVRRIVPESWEETKEWVAAVEKGKVSCETLVLDSATALEALSHKALLSGQSIGDYKGGYKKGHDHILMHWRTMVEQLEAVFKAGKNVIVLAHTKVKEFHDPSGPAYDRFIVSMQEEVGGLICQWADYVLFAREEVVYKDGRATTSGVKYMYTKNVPAHMAKSRGVVGLPEKLPLSWTAFSDAIAAEADMTAAVMKEVEEILVELDDAELSKNVLDWNRSHPEQLLETRNKMRARLETKRKAAEEPKGT